MNHLKRKFLTARWEHLVMANYIVPAEIVQAYVPVGTEIDLWEGNTYLSLVGFMFLDTKVLGLPIPWHQNFEEVNLRMYVKKWDEKSQTWRRGVVFIREIVPKTAIAWVANTIYRENYIALKMKHLIDHNLDDLTVKYEWKFKDKWQKLMVEAEVQSSPLVPNSEAEFITEHYWGYAKWDEKTTLEYQVEHPAWEVFPIKEYQIEVDFAGLYSQKLAPYLQNPHSVFLAKGSEIVVRLGEKMKKEN
jgi:uncharacterized protein YqjF (DUF2071 family)